MRFEVLSEADGVRPERIGDVEACSRRQAMARLLDGQRAATAEQSANGIALGGRWRDVVRFALELCGALVLCGMAGWVFLGVAR